MEYNFRNGVIRWQISKFMKIVQCMFVLALTVSAIFRRNATHCISPYAIVVCVWVCVCVCVCLCVYAAFVDARKTV